ncbi:SGNH/GDSL hydrolase family protein [Agrobacterium tumefaciens]|uniref:SGNH/GDSL hydrolase family protein n=1 Tax=Agrobacterium tumefaciens TaxID=358 RepID=UPI000472C679
MSTTAPDERITTYTPVVPTTEFPALFPIFANNDLSVYVDGVERVDFTVTASYVEGVSNNAKVIMNSGVTGDVVIAGERDPRRQNRFLNGGPLPIKDLNLAFDALEGEMQEARRDIDRSVKSDFGEVGLIIEADIDDGRTLMKDGDRLVAGPDIVAIGNEVEAAKNLVEGWASDIVSQGNVPIYATTVGMLALEVPTSITAIRVNGGSAVGDGKGGTFVDAPNGRPPSFSSGGATARAWYATREKKPRSYVGQVATKSVIPGFSTPSNKQIMSRTRHFARSAIFDLRLIFPNWFHNGNAETASGGTITITAAIEYPIGEFHQVTWSGSASVAVPDLSNSPISDRLSVVIPDGAEFFVRTFLDAPAGIIYSGGKDVDSGEAAAYGPSGIVDQTMGGTIANSGTAAVYTPIAIIGDTNKPSVFIVGDSRESAVGFDVPNTLSDQGYGARSFGQMCGYINVARGGERLSEFVSSHALRLSLASYCSHVFIHEGINDFTAGASASTCLDLLQTIIEYFPDNEVWLATVEPVTTSTDGWITESNQTITASNSQRIAFNDAIRAGIEGAFGYFDVADVVENGRNGGKWQAPAGVALTGDGTHASPNGYAWVEQAGIIIPQQLFTVGSTRRFASRTETRQGKMSDVLVSPASIGPKANVRATKAGTDQIVPSATSTRLTWSALSMDEGGIFNNNQWRPPSGKYSVHGQVYVTAGLVDQAQCSIRIAKNGATISEFIGRANGTSGQCFGVRDIVEANGSDFFEIWVNFAAAGDKTVSGDGSRTYLTAHAI